MDMHPCSNAVMQMFSRFTAEPLDPLKDLAVYVAPGCVRRNERGDWAPSEVPEVSECS